MLLCDVSVSLSAQMQASGKKKKELRYRSVISDIFDGSILSLVQCLTCDRVSVLIAVGQRAVFCRPHRPLFLLVFWFFLAMKLSVSMLWDAAGLLKSWQVGCV